MYTPYEHALACAACQMQAAAPSGAPFAPALLPDLALWLEGSHERTTAGGQPASIGDSVAMWRSRAADLPALSQPTPAVQPSAQPDSLLFDGVDDWLSASFALEPPLTLLLRAQVTYATSYGTLCDGYSGNNTLRLMLLGSNTATLVPSLGGTTNDPVTVDTTQWHTYALTWQGSSATLAIDDAPPVTLAAGTTAPAGLTLGARATATQNGGLLLRGVLLYRRVLAAGELADLRGYLATRDTGA